ncbi:MAG: glycosyltransferase [Elusimicrobiales bacterium]|nr:glycosyltransferase [Elusimicrobiales bacterium]
MKKSSISVIVPAYNEAGNLEGAVASIKAAAEEFFADYEILVIDDCSSDGTGALADKLAAADPHVKVTHNPVNKGFGYNYRLGARLAVMDHVGLIPGDNEIVEESVRDIFSRVGSADMVLPYHTNSEERSWLRRGLSGGFTAIMNFLFGRSLRYYNGPVVHRRDLLSKVKMTTDGFAYQAEILARLLKEGRTYIETGMRIRSRQHGHSSALRPKNVWSVFSAVARLYWDVECCSEEKGVPRAAWWLLGLAFALRAVYVLNVKVLPWCDMEVWDQARLALAAGQPYQAHWTPLFPLLLAGVTRVFGNSYVLMNLVNAVLSTGTCLVIYLGAREAFGRKAGFLALLLAAFYVDFIWYCSVMLAETLGLFFFTGAMYFVIKGRRAGLAGLFMGLACLTKAVFIIGLPAFLFWFWHRRAEGRWLPKALLFAGVTALVIAPWSLRNRYAQESPSVLEPTWADTIFIGHNPYADGGPDFDVMDTPYGAFYRDPAIKPAERSRLALEKALAFIRENPGREAQLFFLKLSKHLTFGTAFGFYLHPYPARGTMFVLALLTNMLAFLLACLGAAHAWKDRNGAGLLAVIAVFVGVFVTLFCAEGRKRLPFIPALLMLAGHGAALLPGAIADLKARRAAALRGPLGAAALAAALLVLNLLYQTATRLGDVLKRFC